MSIRAYWHRLRGKTPPDEADKKKKKDQPSHSAWRENFVSIVVCSIFAFMVTTYVAHPMTVPTSSMEPTILVGDRVVVDKFTVRNAFNSGLPLTPEHAIKRGDIVVFKHPREPQNLWVKRVIGLPGETVEIRRKQVFVDGVPLNEPYKHHKDDYIAPGYGRDNFAPVTVPPDVYFVMGDNRDDSDDSRYWGFLRHDLVVGRPVITFWSYKDKPNAHKKEGLVELVALYGERVIYFIPRTRWNRMFRLIR